MSKTLKKHLDQAREEQKHLKKKLVLESKELVARQRKERKEILPVLMDECGLTKAGASTYYQTIRTRILEDESD